MSGTSGGGALSLLQGRAKNEAGNQVQSLAQSIAKEVRAQPAAGLSEGCVPAAPRLTESGQSPLPPPAFVPAQGGTGEDKSVLPPRDATLALESHL